MESMHTMTSTDRHIIRLPSQDDSMMLSENESSTNMLPSGQMENEKQLSDLVAEAENSNSLIAYSSYNNDENMIEASNSTTVKNESHIERQDVYAQLAQKEKDLVLAAELGKALLGKNEDLARQNEKLADDFSQRLEVRIFNEH